MKYEKYENHPCSETDRGPLGANLPPLAVHHTFLAMLGVSLKSFLYIHIYFPSYIYKGKPILKKVKPNSSGFQVADLDINSKHACFPNNSSPLSLYGPLSIDP